MVFIQYRNCYNFMKMQRLKHCSSFLKLSLTTFNSVSRVWIFCAIKSETPRAFSSGCTDFFRAANSSFRAANSARTSSALRAANSSFKAANSGLTSSAPELAQPSCKAIIPADMNKKSLSITPSLYRNGKR